MQPVMAYLECKDVVRHGVRDETSGASTQLLGKRACSFILQFVSQSQKQSSTNPSERSAIEDSCICNNML